MGRGVTRKLGEVQQNVLDGLKRHRWWSETKCGWNYDGVGRTRKIMDSLVRAGVATVDIDENERRVYRPADTDTDDVPFPVKRIPATDVDESPPEDSSNNPMQPVVLINGIPRFKENRIVSWMLEELNRRGVDLNYAASIFRTQGEGKDDYQQLMQLIGYSVSGYGDLSCCDEDVCARADEISDALSPRSV